MDGSLLLIGTGLLITGGCALAWLEFTADGDDDKAIGRLATIGIEPRVCEGSSPSSWAGVGTCVRAADNGGTDAFSEHAGLGNSGQAAQPAALARGDYGAERRGRKLFVVK